MREFKPLFDPRSVAVIGASRTPGKGGHILVANLVKSGFSGAIYPINPKAEEILGLKAYCSIKDVPEDVDLAVLSVPADVIPEIVHQCAQKKVRYLLIIAGGFAEGGEPGKQLQDKVIQNARVSNMRIIGPNIIGMISTGSNLLLTFAPFTTIRKGDVAIIAQTGAFCGAALHYLLSFSDFGLSKSIDLGNRCDLSESELLEYLMCDPQTHIIVLHIEGLADGRRFLETASLLSRLKPIIVLKFGRTEVASRAITSHTGALAGSEKIYSAAFKQAGLLRVDDLDEVEYVVRALKLSPPPHGNRVCIITFSGGAGAQAADLCIEKGLVVTGLSENTISKIESVSPPWMRLSNPLDIWPAIDKSGNATKTYFEAIQAALSDINVDMIMVLVNISYTLVTQSPVPEELAHTIELPLTKPIAICAIGDKSDLQRFEEAFNGKIPIYPTSKSCALALSKLSEYSSYRRNS
jgi:acyl-CoA synthetase (NDP forming)